MRNLFLGVLPHTLTTRRQSMPRRAALGDNGDCHKATGQVRDSRLDSHRSRGARDEDSVDVGRADKSQGIGLAMHVHVAAMTHTLTTPPRIIGEPAGACGAAPCGRSLPPTLPALTQAVDTLHQRGAIATGKKNHMYEGSCWGAPRQARRGSATPRGLRPQRS